MAAKLKAA
jgi:Mg/Co/Ni transporter MgtE